MKIFSNVLKLSVRLMCISPFKQRSNIYQKEHSEVQQLRILHYSFIIRLKRHKLTSLTKLHMHPIITNFCRIAIKNILKKTIGILV